MKPRIAIFLALLLTVLSIAAVTEFGPVPYPRDLTYDWTAGGTDFDSCTMDSSGDRCAMVFQADKPCTVDRVSLRIGAVTTGATVRVGLQDVSTANGQPDGTADQYRDLAVSTGDANTVVTTGLLTDNGTDGGDKRTLAEGDIVSVVVWYESYTDGNLTVLMVGQGVRGFTQSTYALTDSSGSWSKAGASIPMVTVHCDGGTYLQPYGLQPAFTLAAETFQSTSGTHNAVGIHFTAPAAWQVCGLWAGGVDPDGDLLGSLLSADAGTAHASGSLDKDQLVGNIQEHIAIKFTSRYVLTPGTQYKLVLIGATTTNSTIDYQIFPSGHIAASETGANWFVTRRAISDGVWTNSTDQRYHMGLMICGIDNNAEGGGGAGTRSYGSVH